MSLDQAHAAQLGHQVAAVRLLAQSLYDSTEAYTGPVSPVQNELALLLKVLESLEAQLSVAYRITGSELQSNLKSCRSALVQFQSLRKAPRREGHETAILDIRAHLSDSIFNLGVINANFTMYVGLLAFRGMTMCLIPFQIVPTSPQWFFFER